MITTLSMQNFKSWADTKRIELAPLTGLFGSNSSGKTSLLQLLLMLKQTVDSPDRNLVLNLGDDRSPVDLGTFQDLLHRHEVSRTVDWQLEWKLAEPLTVADPTKKEAELFRGDELAFAAQVAWQGNGSTNVGRAVVRHMAYTFSGAEFGMRPRRVQPEEFELFCKNTSFAFKRERGRPWHLPHPAKSYGFPDQVRGYYQNAGFLSDFELEFEKLFARLFYLGPLREYPKRQYAWAGGQPADVGRRGERVVEALLASREGRVRYPLGRGVRRKTLEELVAQWLKKLQLIDSFEVRPVTEGGKLFQVWVRHHPESQEVLITDVGFGVSQILPVITLCYYAPERSILLLEQPEIHLHPRVQAGLADVLVDAIKTRGIQIVLESHSEHLLRRLQRRIAEERLLARDAALYFCAMEQGASRLTRLSVDMFGNIENWPEDFFGDELGEIAAMHKAMVRRKTLSPR